MPTIPLSNLTSGQSIFSPEVGLVSVASQVQWSLDTAQNASLLMTETTTLMNPTGMAGKAGKFCFLEIIQSSSTPYKLFYDTAYTNGGTLPPISTALGAVDGLILRCTGTEMQVWLCTQNVGG